MMDVRNPVYNRFGTIDCEVNHPRFGWIPFTATPDDAPEIYAAALAMNPAPYVAPPVVVIIPDTVSARQFKLQLEIQGLTAAVEGWVAAQTKLVQIAYNNSGSFDRNEPMLQAGFNALGFTSQQLDTFYTKAAKL